MKKNNEEKFLKQLEEIFTKGNQYYSDQEIIERTEAATKYLDKRGEYELKRKIKIFCALTLKDLNLKVKWIRESFFKTKNNTLVYDWLSLTTILKASSLEIQEILLNSLLSNRVFERKQESLPISNFPRYGVELEYCSLQFEMIRTLATTDQLLAKMMYAMKIPEELVSQITNCLVFEKKNVTTKWNLSKECGNDWTPEISSPIMTNSLNDLNQLKAVCMLFKELGAMTDEATGLHINIDANYFEGNITALKNLLIIWGECEELFYKLASGDHKRIRTVAKRFCSPIKDNIQKTFQENPTLKLETKEDFYSFIYTIQVRNRLETVLRLKGVNLKAYDDIETLTELEKYNLFKKSFSKTDFYHYGVRYTSLNFSQMKWYKKDKGRIEFRIFDNSLSYQVVIENLLLIARLCEVSLNLTKSNQRQSQFFLLQEHEVSEEEKLNRLLDLLFDEKQIKEVFKQRWQRVKDDSFYQQFTGEIATFSHRESSHYLSKHL